MAITFTKLIPTPIAGFRHPPLMGYASKTQDPKAMEVNRMLNYTSLENLVCLSYWIMNISTKRNVASNSITMA